jgi:quinolinate synthase
MTEIDTIETASVAAEVAPSRTTKPRRAAPRKKPDAATFPVLDMPSLEFSPQVEAATAHLYAKVAHVIPPIEWPFYAPYVKAINDLKQVRNAVILAHNYMTPDIYHCVADFVGDSLSLAREAARTEADVIVQAGVHFMAETSKLINPSKTVLLPDLNAGCSLAAAITGADVRLFRERFPGVPVVSYVNTSAEVKAESDICCTPANAVKVVESLNAPRVILIPDHYQARYVASQTSVKIIAWKGTCEVHERFTGAELTRYRDEDPGVRIVTHPECPPDVLAVADFTGSTAAMIDYVKRQNGGRIVLVTECSMADNIAVEAPEAEFVRPCNLCPHMKRITLPKILDTLVHMTEEVTVAPEVAERARVAVERMIHLSM